MKIAEEYPLTVEGVRQAQQDAIDTALGVVKGIIIPKYMEDCMDDEAFEDTKALIAEAKELIAEEITELKKEIGRP